MGGGSYAEFSQQLKTMSGVHTCIFSWPLWNKGGEINALGKAVLTPSENAVHFFFDDNLGLRGAGTAETRGCANVRDSQHRYVDYGQFRTVDLREVHHATETDNDFRKTRDMVFEGRPLSAGKNVPCHDDGCVAEYDDHLLRFCSPIKVSPDGSVVLVEVSILDPMADPFFFVRIVWYFTKMGGGIAEETPKIEKTAVALVDVNKTVYLADGAGGKSSEECLYEALYDAIEVIGADDSAASSGADGRASPRRVCLYNLLKRQEKLRVTRPESLDTYLERLRSAGRSNMPRFLLGGSEVAGSSASLRALAAEYRTILPASWVPDAWSCLVNFCALEGSAEKMSLVLLYTFGTDADHVFAGTWAKALPAVGARKTFLSTDPDVVEDDRARMAEKYDVEL